MKRNEWLLLGFSLLIAFGACELITRLVAPPPRFLALSRMKTVSEKPVEESGKLDKSQGGSKNWLFYATPSGRRLRPHARGVIENHYLNGKNIFIRTNALGLRGEEVDPARHPRFLYLGDSVTMGDYLDEKETFVGLIEARANQNGARWQNLNAGIGSIGIGTERAMLEELGPLAKPDVVVLNFYLNDVVSSPAVELIPVPPLLAASWMVQYAFQAASTVRHLVGEPDGVNLKGADWKKWQQDLATLYPGKKGNPKTERAAFNELMQKNLRDWGSAWSPDALVRITQEIDHIQRLSQKFNAKLIVVLHPVSWQVEADFLADEPQQQLIQNLKARNIPAVDLLPVLRTAYRTAPAQPLFYDQCHHTAHGSRLVADTLYDFISHQ